MFARGRSQPTIGEVLARKMPERRPGPERMKLSVRQAARLLSVSESEVYRWVEEGEIPCVLVKNQPLFGRAELLEWATARRLRYRSSCSRTGTTEDRGFVSPTRLNMAAFITTCRARIAHPFSRRSSRGFRSAKT